MDSKVEIWKTCVEAVNRLETRRDNLSNWFGVILTILAVSNVITASYYGSIVISVLGILLCLCWYMLLMNFLLLAEKKFVVIGKLEESWDIKPMLDEWKLVKEVQPKFGITKLQNLVPILFTVFFTALLILVLFRVL